jgi:hypothetical protein
MIYKNPGGKGKKEGRNKSRVKKEKQRSTWRKKEKRGGTGVGSFSY